MADFKTYKVTNRYKRQPLTSSKVKTLDQLRSEIQAIKTKKAEEEKYQADLMAYEQEAKQAEQASIQQAQTEEAKPKGNFFQKAGDTIADFLGHVGGAAVGFGENISDASLNLVEGGTSLVRKGEAGFYDLIGNEAKAEQIRNMAGNLPLVTKAQDIQDSDAEKAQNAIIGATDKLDYTTLKEGGIAEQVAEGIGGMLPAILVSIPTGGASMLTVMGMQSFGSSSEQAINEGATSEQALAYGALSAAKEVLTEKLFGFGLGKLTGMTGWLDNVIAKVARNSVGKFLMGIVGEGAEEAISEFIDPYLKNMTYSEGNKVDWSNVMQSAIVGSLTAVVFEGANTVIKKATNADVTEILSEYDKQTALEQANAKESTLTDSDLAKLNDTKLRLTDQLQVKLDKMNPTERLNFLAKYGQHELIAKYSDRIGSGKAMEQQGIKTAEAVDETVKAPISEEVVVETPKVEETTLPKEAVVAEPKIETATEAKQPLIQGQKESKFKTTTAEATRGYFSQELQDRIDTEQLVYDVIDNNRTVDKAKAKLKDGDTKGQVEKSLLKLNSNKRITADDFAEAILIMQKANKEGLYAEASDLLMATSMAATEMGQGIQALSIINRLTPEGRLMTFQRVMAKENKIAAEKGKYQNDKRFKQIVSERAEKWLKGDLRLVKKQSIKRFVDANPDLALTDEQIKRLGSLTTTSDNFTKNVIETVGNTELGTKLANDILKGEKDLTKSYNEDLIVIPAVMADSLMNATTEANAKEAVSSIKKVMEEQKLSGIYARINAWRYLAMLGNPKTHIRNIISNAVMGEVVNLRNVVSRALQTVFKVKTENRTRSFTKPTYEMEKYARSISETAISELNDGAKYGEAGVQQRTFKVKALETIRKFNFNLLEKEDINVVIPRMAMELSEWATSKGYTVSQLKSDLKLLEQGRLWALEQAQKATFRNANMFTTWMNNLKSKGIIYRLVIDAVVPFTKTPVNIAARAIEYSPIGLVKTIATDITKLKKGEITSGQFIDNISAGLVGTGITFLGMFLASLGIMAGGNDENKKVSNYEKAIGEQAFSVRIGEKTYTLDWLSPSAIPLFMGVSLYEGLVSQDKEDYWAILGSFMASLDPMTEMSFLQGFNNALSTYDDNKIGGFLTSAVQSYLSQFFPTMGSQIAKVIDGTRRSTTSTATGYTKKIETALNFIKAKIPFLAQTLQPYINVWGEEEVTASWEDRIMENGAYPFWISKTKPTMVDNEIMRLYELNGNTDVMPSIPSSYYTADGVRIDMTEGEYTAFKKEVGQFSYTQLQLLFASSAYKNMTDDDKELAVKKVYDYARDFAKKKDKYLVYTALGDKSSHLSKYLIDIGSLEGIKDSKGLTISGTKKKSVETYINAQQLSKEQKHILFALAGYKNTSDKDSVKAYIDSLNLTDEQKKALWEMCNYD